MAIELQGGGYTALIDEKRGANCIRLRHAASGASLLRERGAEQQVDNPYLYGMPILYPANRIAGGCFTFEGRRYTFPINEPQTQCHLHGTLHETPFAVTERGAEHVTCVFDRPYLNFPHRFRLSLTYRLSADGMEQITAIENLSEENMPSFLSFHTTFRVPFLAGSAAEDVRVLAEVGDEVERGITYLPTGRLLPPDEIGREMNAGTFSPTSAPLSRNCFAAKGGRLELRDMKREIAAVYEVDKKFPFRLIYNGQADEYICLEPMTCMANCQNAPFEREFAGFDSIAPGEVRTYRCRLYLKPLYGRAL